MGWIFHTVIIELSFSLGGGGTLRNKNDRNTYGATMPKTGLASYMIRKWHGNEAGNSSVHRPGVFLFLVGWRPLCRGGSKYHQL